MKVFRILPAVLLSFALLLIGCNTIDLESDNNTITPETNPQAPFSLTAEIPGQTTRVALGQDNLTITLAWEINDEIQLLFVQNDNKYTETATVSEIMEEGKKAKFEFNLPAEINTETLFDLYGVYGGEGLDETNPELAKLPANPGVASSLPLLQESEDIILFFENKNTNLQEPVTVSFAHLGSIFNIEITNTDTAPLTGISEARLVAETSGWAYNNTGTGKYNLLTGEFESPEGAGSYLSFTPPVGTIPAGESITLWGWYPPLPGVNWPEINLELSGIWGATPLTTTDSKDARTSPTAPGRAFYFEAYWDGTNLTFEEPAAEDPFHSYEGLNMNAQHTSVHNYFLNLETGIVSNGDNFIDLDPITIQYDGDVHSAANTPKVTKAEYDSVDPYMFMREVSGRVFFYGPAHNNGSLYQFRRPSDNGRIIEVTPSYGTPIIFFRTLEKGKASEKAAYDIIKSGDKAQIGTLFDDSFIDGIVLNANGNSTTDGLSSIPNGLLDAVRSDPAVSNQRPWAQDIFTKHGGNHETGISLDPESVVLVLYYHHEGVGDRKTTLKKWGFLDIYNYTQVNNPRSTSSIDFNLYWKKEVK